MKLSEVLRGYISELYNEYANYGMPLDEVSIGMELANRVEKLEAQKHAMRRCENCKHERKCFPPMSYTPTNEACTDDNLYSWELAEDKE